MAMETPDAKRLSSPPVRHQTPQMLSPLSQAAQRSPLGDRLQTSASRSAHARILPTPQKPEKLRPVGRVLPNLETDRTFLRLQRQLEEERALRESLQQELDAEIAAREESERCTLKRRLSISNLEKELRLERSLREESNLALLSASEGGKEAQEQAEKKEIAMLKARIRILEEQQERSESEAEEALQEAWQTTWNERRLRQEREKELEQERTCRIQLEDELTEEIRLREEAERLAADEFVLRKRTENRTKAKHTEK